MPDSVPEEALGPVRSVTGGAGIEGGPAIVSARPRGRAPRCAAGAATAGTGWRRAAGARPTSAPPDATPGTRPCARGAPSTARGPRRCPGRARRRAGSPRPPGARTSLRRGGTGGRRRTPSPVCPRRGRGKASRSPRGRPASRAGPQARPADPGGTRGARRPGRGDRPPADRAKLVRGPGLPLPESPEDLTGGRGSALWRGRLPEEGLRTAFRADAADAAGEPGRRLARAQPLPDARVRAAVARGGAKAGGHPEVDWARGPRRPRLGGERQGQGRDRAGLRVPRHRQPHRPRDARVLGPEANAAGRGGGDAISTHTNSRSLRFGSILTTTTCRAPSVAGYGQKN